MSKYLFLDVDGVLNNYGWYEKMAKAHPPKTRHIDFKNDLERAQIDWDPDNVAQLERISLAIPEVQIVISSTWRRLYWLPDIRGFIKNAGGATAWSKVIDKTPYRPELLKIRGQEIKWWLDNVGDDDCKFVILDDDSDMLPEQKAGHFVQTHYLGGLTAELADEAIRILT